MAFGEAPARHEAPRPRRRLTRNDLTQLVSYGVNGLFTAVVYSAAVWTLIAISHHTFALDVVVAYAFAVVCNYLGARRIFRPATNLRGHVARYLVVVAGAFATTTLLAWLFHRAGLPDLIGAYLPVALSALPTFLALRLWVFRPAPQSH